MLSDQRPYNSVFLPNIVMDQLRLTRPSTVLRADLRTMSKLEVIDHATSCRIPKKEPELA